MGGSNSGLIFRVGRDRGSGDEGAGTGDKRIGSSARHRYLAPASVDLRGIAIPSIESQFAAQGCSDEGGASSSSLDPSCACRPDTCFDENLGSILLAPEAAD